MLFQTAQNATGDNFAVAPHKPNISVDDPMVKLPNLGYRTISNSMTPAVNNLRITNNDYRPSD